MTISQVVGVLFIAVGTFFFLSGTVGLLRFPDIYCRLHALTKADNVGLGFIVLGLALQATEWWTVAKLIFIWFLVLLGSATASHLVARVALRAGIMPWRKE